MQNIIGLLVGLIVIIVLIYILATLCRPLVRAADIGSKGLEYPGFLGRLRHLSRG